MHDENTFHINSSEDFQLVNDAICEALDCNELASKKVPVNVGKYGILEFFVCKYHVSIFQEDNFND